MISAHNSGIWKTAKGIHAKVGGAWVKAKKVYTKSGGVWNKVYASAAIPANMLVLYDTAPVDGAAGFLCNGANGTPNLLDRFVKLSSTALLIGGTASHGGADHGAITTTFSTDAFPPLTVGKANTYLGGYYLSEAPHTHTFSAPHYHPSQVTNSTLFERRGAIPYIGGTAIYQNAIFFNRAALSDAAWAAYTSAKNRALMLASTAASGSAASHNHGAVTQSSNTYAANVKTRQESAKNNTSGKYVSANHYHNASHTDATVSGPARLAGYRMYQYRYSGAEPLLSIENLPINTVAFFTSSELPDGWAALTAANDKFCYFSDNSTVTEMSAANLTHNHVKSGNVAPSNLPPEVSEFSSFLDPSYFGGGTHKHTYSDNHDTYVDITPPYVTLVAAYKNY